MLEMLSRVAGLKLLTYTVFHDWSVLSSRSCDLPLSLSESVATFIHFSAPVCSVTNFGSDACSVAAI